MTVSTPNYLLDMYDATKAMGNNAISAEFAFEIVGFEQYVMLAKQCPWPVLSVTGEIEVPMPMGAARFIPQQTKVNGQGPITLMETAAGHVDKLIIDLLRNGARFDATVYEGSPQRFSRAKRLTDCFIQLDSPDRDWENRAQILMFTGTLFFHYFGEDIQGPGL